jgi:hypothetical protein
VTRLLLFTPVDPVVPPLLVSELEVVNAPDAPKVLPVLQSVVALFTIASAMRPRAARLRATRNDLAFKLRFPGSPKPPVCWVWPALVEDAEEPVVADPLPDVVAALNPLEAVAADPEAVLVEELHALAVEPLDKKGFASVPPWAVESHFRPL